MTFNLNILRGPRFVTSYLFSGTKKDAILEAKRLLTIHAYAVISVENQSGQIVGVCK